MTKIHLKDVRKAYGPHEVLHGLNFDIASGEFMVLLGPSGCGKSTLLRMLAGLEAITSGEAAFDGKVVNTLEPSERGCAMVFQNYALYPHMTVAQNIGYALKIAGVPKAARAEKVAKVAASLGLADYLDRKPSQLSGGQRQRVAMGRAMIREPKVFLYDEPLSNLDARLRVAMRIEIRKLHQRLGATSIFVTHDQVEAMTLADRIAVMNGGHIEQLGTPETIYHRPETVFVASFIGTPGMNLLPVTADPARSVLRFGDGQEIGYDAAAWPMVPAGPVTLGCRAEAIALVGAETPAPAGQGAVRATVEFSEELGSGKLVHTALAGEPLLIHVASGTRPVNGQPVGLHLAHSEMHLFDAETGKRLRQPSVS